MTMISEQNSLQEIPDELRERLKTLYQEMKTNFVHRRFKPAVLEAAHFCEVVYRILEWKASNDGNCTPVGKSIRNFGRAVSCFECDTNLDDSIRFHIPNLLKSIYTIRNKRGVGHVAKDIDPNLMDATLVVTCADWIMAELIRLFHNLPTEEAQKIVDDLVTKRIPTVWRVGNTEHRRVLNPPGCNLSAKERVLLLLYHASPEPIAVDDLLRWSEYQNPSRFRSKVLSDLHSNQKIAFYSKSDEVHLSPLGKNYVEKNLPLHFLLT